MKLYAVSDGPPSLAVRMALEALNIPYEHVSVDYGKAEHLTAEYEKVRRDEKWLPTIPTNDSNVISSLLLPTHPNPHRCSR